MKPFFTPGGKHELKYAYTRFQLACSELLSKMDSSFNLSPLETTVSRNVSSLSDISALNLTVGSDLKASSIKR